MKGPAAAAVAGSHEAPAAPVDRDLRRAPLFTSASAAPGVGFAASAGAAPVDLRLRPPPAGAAAAAAAFPFFPAGASPAALPAAGASPLAPPRGRFPSAFALPASALALVPASAAQSAAVSPAAPDGLASPSAPAPARRFFAPAPLALALLPAGFPPAAPSPSSPAASSGGPRLRPLLPEAPPPDPALWRRRAARHNHSPRKRVEVWRRRCGHRRERLEAPGEGAPPFFFWRAGTKALVRPFTVM